MTDGQSQHGAKFSPIPRSPDLLAVPDLSLQIPKNKSTSNLLAAPESAPVDAGRARFSFDGGTAQELKASTRGDPDRLLGVSGLRRIRRPGAPLRPPSLRFDDHDFTPGTLNSVKTMPVSGSSSRSASMGVLTSGPTSPALEDLHRFPTESLHSFSFARQSEDFLHSRQSILQKSVDFMRDRSNWAANPGLAHATARVSGDAEIQGMMDLLRKANIIPSTNSREPKERGFSLGPMTGPADVEGRNIFEKSFSTSFEPVEEAIISPSTEDGPGEGLSMIDNSLENSQADVRISIAPATTPSAPRRLGLKRTYTDLSAMTLQQKLIEALAQPYSSEEPATPSIFMTTGVLPSTGLPQTVAGSTSTPHHSSKWMPTAQAVFRTSAEAPWTIHAANDLACLVFGVTRAELKSLSILGIIQEERRKWLEDKLGAPDSSKKSSPKTSVVPSNGSSLVGGKGGITARLLSKAPSRSQTSKKAQTDDGSGGFYQPKNHPPTKSRGVLLCGDIVPVQKRDGRVGAASIWVMEKRGGLIWVIEEIAENLAYLTVNQDAKVVKTTGDSEQIWGQNIESGMPLQMLLPALPMEDLYFDKHTNQPLRQVGNYTVRTADGINIPTSVAELPGSVVRVASLPHIAGVMVLDPKTLEVLSSNSVFSAALFGHDRLDRTPVSALIPSFPEILASLRDDEGIDLVDGLIIPEHSFRKARALLALREGRENAASIFMRPTGLPAKHRDGSELMVDIQMRVVNSEAAFPKRENAIIEEREEHQLDSKVAVSQLVYAVWVTYSRQLHSVSAGVIPRPPVTERPFSPPGQPIPEDPAPAPNAVSNESSKDSSELSLVLTETIGNGPATGDEPIEHPAVPTPGVLPFKKSINDFVILEEMGSGAYGQVKLVRYKKNRSRKMVLKYVTKRRILVDTWTRDRKLGTVPLEIHVLNYLRRDDLRHPNIVDMVDFFEDDVNYYIEMLPHGIPGVDLFDYIELRANMEEGECRSIFKQVVDAIHHLHVKALVVHRDIKDENVVLDGEGKIKLIDFGSAAYIKNGPFDVFVGTIDYAAPEVLQGKAYGGKEQDVWALGILLYTIVYKENPFYNIDEILDHPLRVPYLPFSEDCIDLVRKMLDRDVEERFTIEEVWSHPWLIED